MFSKRCTRVGVVLLPGAILLNPSSGLRPQDFQPTLINARVQQFFRLAQERYAIRARRVEQPNKPKTWTKDPIFRHWRFCNVYREHDKTTEWFREHVRDRLKEDAESSIVMTTLFRWFNRIATGERLLPVLQAGCKGYDETLIRSLLEGCKPLVTGAYMIKTPPGLNKLDGILHCMKPLVKDAAHLAGRIEPGDTTLEGFWTVLRMYPYLGSFMSYEIVTDLRHTCVLRDAPDINTWAAAGPGCARGLSWLVGNDPNFYSYVSQSNQQCMQVLMKKLLEKSRDKKFWPNTEAPAWEMREVEHWLCEYWKYIRCHQFGQAPKEKVRWPTS